MSRAVKEIQTFVAIDPRINQHDNNEYLINKGGSYYGWQQINANNISQNSATWTFNSPSVKTFIDRSIWVRHRISFAFNGVNATPGTPLIMLGISDSLCYRPLAHRLYDTITGTFNSTSVTFNSSDVQPALARTNYCEDLRRYQLSTSPCGIMDQHQNFEDSSNPAHPYFNLYSQNDAEYGQYGQGGIYGDGRGCFAYVSNTIIDDDNQVIVYDITEPLPLSPCVETDKHLVKAFIGLITLSMNITFNNSAISGGAMWSHNSILGNVLNSVTATVLSGQLLLNVVNPPDTMPLYRGIISYPYHRFDRYISPVGVIAAGATLTQFTANTVTLPIYPSRFYIYARQNPNNWTYESTETYALLQNLNITMRSKNGLIASASIQQLYQICADAGLRLSYTQFSRDVGSILVIDIELLALDDDAAAGVMEQIQIQVQADITNLNLINDINFQFIIVACNPGIMNIDQATQTCSTQVGIISKNDVINSSLSPTVDYHLVEELYGGDFGSKLKTFGSKVSSFVDKASPYVKKYGPQIAEAAIKYGPELAALIGLGDEGGDMDGGRRRRKAPAKRKLKHRY